MYVVPHFDFFCWQFIKLETFVPEFNCLSLKRILRRTEHQQSKSKLNRKVEIGISTVKEEVWFVMQSDHWRSAVQTLLIDSCQEILFGNNHLFPTRFVRSKCLLLFFFVGRFSWWNQISLTGKRKNHSTNWHYKITLSTVLKYLPTPFGKVGKIESCHKCARTILILFWARALFVCLFNWRVHLVRLLTS